MKDEWLYPLKAWAQDNGNVRQLWLFGSRAKGNSKEDSDVDLAVVLMPPIGKHDYAFGNYMALGDAWQRHLGGIVGRHVSLEAIEPDDEITKTGIKLWSRD